MSGVRLIVSLTSFPPRIAILHSCIETLLNQSHKPDIIILWLGESQFPNREADLPKSLLDLVHQGLVIKWTFDIRSYTKLIPALKEFPDDIIVTADDDILYPSDWLDILVKSYKKNPNMIHVHRCHQITFLKKGVVSPYLLWNFDYRTQGASFNMFLTGVGGVLYPPHCLYKDILNQELFLKVSPFNDDIWFWAMAVLNNTKVCLVENHIQGLNFVKGSFVPESLCLINVNQDKNSEQMGNVLRYYPEIIGKLKFIKVNHVKFWDRIFSIKREYKGNVKRKFLYIFGLKFRLKKRMIK